MCHCDIGNIIARSMEICVADEGPTAEASRFMETEPGKQRTPSWWPRPRRRPLPNVKKVVRMACSNDVLRGVYLALKSKATSSTTVTVRYLENNLCSSIRYSLQSNEVKSIVAYAHYSIDLPWWA